MTELDRLDPPPRRPRAPRAPRRSKDMEKGVLADLEKMPPDLRQSAVAAGALLLARDLDAGGPTSKDSAGHIRKLARLLDDGEITGEQAASALLMLAAHIEGGMASRDRAGHVREMRMNMTQLREWNPGGQEGDRTDEARDQVERTRGLYVVEGESG